jgi:GrpB-like predicted nucleotidyltransferase (UPF0157 family)
MSAPVDRRTIRVMDYNAEWPDHFAQILDRIWPCVRDIAIRIEHVGSTAVVGLAAKPVIDLDLVIARRGDLPSVVTRLGGFGYQHRGDLGIPDREAFRAPENHPAHHLYVCSQDSLALRNHIVFRDHLRAHPADAAAYSMLKRQLAEVCGGDIDRYVGGKTNFILSILAQYG